MHRETHAKNLRVYKIKCFETFNNPQTIITANELRPDRAGLGLKNSSSLLTVSSDKYTQR